VHHYVLHETINLWTPISMKTWQFTLDSKFWPVLTILHVVTASCYMPPHLPVHTYWQKQWWSPWGYIVDLEDPFNGLLPSWFMSLALALALCWLFRCIEAAAKKIIVNFEMTKIYYFLVMAQWTMAADVLSQNAYTFRMIWMTC